MGKKIKYIHIRADEALKQALADAARRHMRKETDEARYQLMKALGILLEEHTPPYDARAPSYQKETGSRQR